MFHRFHDLKTGQDADMMSGLSRSSGSSSGGAPGNRGLFPSMLRPDLAPTPQATSNPQYPSVSSPEPGFVQGSSLMALGHNVMFPGAKLMPGTAHEAHRYMAEAYRLAAEEHERLPYSSGSQSILSDRNTTESSPPVADIRQHSSSHSSSHASSQRQSHPERPFNSVDMTSHLLDSRMDTHSRILSTMDRQPHSGTSRVPTVPVSIAKTDSDENFGKSTYTSSAGNISPQMTKGKSTPCPVPSGTAPMFPMSFPSPYQHYSDENNHFKRQYFDEAFSRKEATDSPSESNTSELNRERNESGEAGSHVNFDQCSNQEAFNRQELPKPVPRPEDLLDSELSRLAQATTSHSEMMRAKMAKGRQGKLYKCDQCQLEFKNGTQLKNHTWRHSGEKPHACTVCHHTFTQLSNLKTHMRIHTGERPYACQECDATFTQISNLRTHQKIHTGEKPYQCDVCFTRFSQQSNLKSHKLIHSGERPFKCEECGSSFVQSTHLRNHMRIHTNERPYGCDQCGARFRQLSNLKTHEKIHTGERPYSCEECGSTFAQKSNLKSHMMKLHAQDGGAPSKRGRKRKLAAIRPYTCEECGAKFTMMSNLKIHSRLHSGERPFQCVTCGASFAQKSNLKTHETIHSEERPFKCSDCPAAFRQNTNLKTHKMKKHPVKSLKNKILQDSHYSEMPPLEGEGGTGNLIGEPIVQIKEGKGDQFHLPILGDSSVEGGEMVKLEEKMFGRQDTSNMYRNDEMGQHEVNPYDSSNF